MCRILIKIFACTVAYQQSGNSPAATGAGTGGATIAMLVYNHSPVIQRFRIELRNML
jgi:hypothetical protein